MGILGRVEAQTLSHMKIDYWNLKVEVVKNQVKKGQELKMDCGVHYMIVARQALGHQKVDRSSLKRKYCTKAEIQAEKKAGEEKNAQAEEAKKVKIQQVARLEERIVEEDLIDSEDEPKDAPPAKKAKLSKQQICITIEDACKELASGGGKAMVDDKKSDGCHCKATAVVPHGDENNNPMLDKVWIKLGCNNKGAYTDIISGWVNSIETPSLLPSQASGTSSMASKQPSLTLTNGYRRSSTMMTSTKPKLTANHEHACESQGVPIGGFSNGEELDGPECEIAIDNPPKGNKCLAGSDIIRVEDIHPDWIIEESKKAKSRVMNNNLPPAIWLTIYHDINYRVELNDLVFKLALQRISDTWQSHIGSTAITIINAFFTSDEVADIFTTDESQQDFAMNALEGLKFLYDLFCGAFVLQTFVAHMNTISGSVKVSALGNPREPSQLPSAGLGISVAVVERALTLWKTGAITIDAVETSHSTNKAIALKSMLNKSTGKISSGILTFNKANLGVATCAYTQSTQEMDPYHLIKIMELVNKFVKGKSSHHDYLLTSASNQYLALLCAQQMDAFPSNLTTYFGAEYILNFMLKIILIFQ
ncbi:hypothetical protein BJV74DRAFT_797286 [Russula compacta]|nr:hypothetical protein BJV74DRAFT_797286 [Russula compacta]